MRILITGANRGIGAELRTTYAARGEQVLGTSRAPSETPGMHVLDVTDPSSQAALAAELDGVGLDLLVCNAGVYLDKGFTLDTPDQAQVWADSFAANTTGVFLTVQHLLPNLRRNGGKIAILSSKMASSQRAPGGSLAYRASKAAALNLGRNLATDLKPQGIAVGIYHPGWVQTEMGGAEAAIDVGTAVTGLVARFDALSIATTGCFEDYAGEPIAY